MDNKILEGLNPTQKEAVLTLSGPVLILAGAGSGKTKTLTHRIANLIINGVTPSAILAVTFTNKAAKEMRERLAALLGAENNFSFMRYMGTFHGICVKILRIEYEAAGLGRNFVIYDEDDKVSLIKRAIKNLGITDKSIKPKSIGNIISSAKNDFISASEYAVNAVHPNEKINAQIYTEYENMRIESDAVDFDDILLYVARMFKKRPEVREKWSKHFKHILIDEYQDTNTVQYKIVRMLVNEERNICVVGDDWQSIYSWRGADFRNILNFEKDFKGAKVIKLEQNYRSTSSILNASQKVIVKNKKRTDKMLFTELGEGKPIEIRNMKDETEEASEIVSLIRKSKRPFSDFAILYRTNAQSYAFEKALINSVIPYKLIGGIRFYSRAEIKDILAYLKLIVNPNDSVSLARVLNVPARGIGAVSVAKILSGDIAGLTGKTRDRYNEFMQLLADLREKDTAEVPPSVLVTELIERIGYEDYLRNDDKFKAEEKIENIQTFVGEISSYLTLSEFLSDAVLMSSADEAVSADSVTLMTIHSSKGLEFPVVFLVGLEDGLFPHIGYGDFNVNANEELEEERRLMYVGMTRAMEELTLTFADSRFVWGGRRYNKPSRFLQDIDENFLEEYCHSLPF